MCVMSSKSLIFFLWLISMKKYEMSNYFENYCPSSSRGSLLQFCLVLSVLLQKNALGLWKNLLSKRTT